MPRIILDAVAVADLLHHLQVEHGALPQALRFDQLALFLQFLMPPVELRHDAGHGRPHAGAMIPAVWPPVTSQRDVPTCQIWTLHLASMRKMPASIRRRRHCW